MATTEKPIALQSELDQAEQAFSNFLTPEEEAPEEVEAVETEEESIEAVEEVSEEPEMEAEAEEAVEEIETEDLEEIQEESQEDQVEVAESEQPQLYTIKVDGVDTEVSIEELQNGYSRQKTIRVKLKNWPINAKTLKANKQS